MTTTTKAQQYRKLEDEGICCLCKNEEGWGTGAWSKTPHNHDGEDEDGEEMLICCDCYCKTHDSHCPDAGRYEEEEEETETKYFSVDSKDLLRYFEVDDGLTKDGEWKDEEECGYYRLEYEGIDVDSPTHYGIRWRFDADICDAPERVLKSKAFLRLSEEWTTIGWINTSSGFALASCGWE
jgi:hypothetical protein